MKDIMEIFDQVLARIKPNKGAKLKIMPVLNRLDELLKKAKLNAKVVLGGSFAKNTFLKDDFDVDIFVSFKKEYEDKDISLLLEKAIKPLKPIKVHGSRDYFQLKKDDINYEIIPVLQVKSESKAQNVTDYSPLHVKWVKDNINNLNDDIRVAKQFCKAANVYGAESYIRGISGHTLDILIIHYGGFVNLLKAITRWKSKKVIDHYNVYKGKAVRSLNQSKVLGPLIVIDPIFEQRNAAANLDEENFNILIKQAKAFLKKPSIDFFTEKEVDLEEKASKGHLILVDVIPKKAKIDVMGSKLRSCFERIKDDLKEFIIVDAGWDWKHENALFWFVVKHKELDKEMLHLGPPISRQDHVKAFKKQYKDVFDDGIRLFAKVKRKHTTPESLIKELLSDKFITSRTKKVKVK